ncbi:MAG: type I-E CRISPR-associated protein Cas6/Cse3/CasE [Nitrospirales bacterium]|nr:MAG: type I-E CRISPR-associated protein Cas6/Cse3/CasE [Nitrospirales bacterium]
MFLSRVAIPWEQSRNPYEFHRHLWQLFPNGEKEPRTNNEETRQGFLFRIEGNKPGRPACLLVQSRRYPVPVTDFKLLSTREFHPKPVKGQRLGFILTANPIKTISDSQCESKPTKKSKKCRVPLIREKEQHAWLTRKLAMASEIETANIQPQPPLYFRKGHRAGKLGTVTFEGILHVREPANLIYLLENGVGPAKGFGCGLLLVRRM